jgi:phosphate/phosphite/phosphonate ABC transporter binding protein
VGERESASGYRVPDRLCVGMVLASEPNTTRGLLEQFCMALTDATGVSVEPRGVWHYHHLLEGLADGEIDIVWLPPMLALRANQRVVPIALPIRDGVTFFRAALFTRRDSPIRTLDDVKGVRAAWVDRQSAAGYLIIRAHLEQLGVHCEDAFASDTFVGTHDGVASAVFDRDADVGATYCYLDEKATEPIVKRAGWGTMKMRVLTHSAPIPMDVIACDARVPSLVRRLVQSALIEVQDRELQKAARNLLGAEGFIAPKPEHLDPLYALLGSLPEPVAAPHSLFPPPPK